ncbi:MAG: hypothetical protein K6C05_00020 [Anaerovibrio sp.]|uniref:hypothetical protein n=1 Tax=Anaerovibrio sp. TaxID=1872532 RepID=UPI0025D68FBB|nr:hypothetical protein [Anaerovibrio sp.]MCR5175216.1 hypothetical protein [Anaerovibrio sp.]
MKKIFILLFSFALIAVNSNAIYSTAHAREIWIAHLPEENADVYLIDNTIKSGTSQTGKWFTIVTREVKSDGTSNKTMSWDFSSFGGGEWRYYTDMMATKLTTARVVAPNRLFEICMDKIGWKYRIVDIGYR